MSAGPNAPGPNAPGPIVKICGVVDSEGAAEVARAGADWIGLNFWPGSPRAVDAARGRAIAAAIRAARPETAIVGVFVREDPARARAIAEEVGLDRVQLHGDEPPERARALGRRAIVAVRVAGDPAPALERARALPAESALLVDAPGSGYGGTGQQADWEVARRLVQAGRTVILAGGLAPENVAEAVRAARPAGVDVASGVESAPGVKDVGRVRAFVDAARRAARATEDERSSP